MSKIKDLYAVENNIDDLIPAESLGDKVFAKAKQLFDPNYFYECAIYDKRYDEFGHVETVVENFQLLCDGLAEDSMDEYIQEQHLDISNKVYLNTIKTVSASIANWLAEFELEMTEESDG